MNMIFDSANMVDWSGYQNLRASSNAAKNLNWFWTRIAKTVSGNKWVSDRI
jgi:hypothetical protein